MNTEPLTFFFSFVLPQPMNLFMIWIIENLPYKISIIFGFFQFLDCALTPIKLYLVIDAF